MEAYHNLAEHGYLADLIAAGARILIPVALYWAGRAPGNAVM